MKVSFVMPTRNRQGEIVARLKQIFEALDALSVTDREVIVVDDGSHDETLSAVNEARQAQPQLRGIRHDRPRGMEAAGQTGLERATGEIVFILEKDCHFSFKDLIQLLELSQDPTVVAARIENECAIGFQSTSSSLTLLGS